jgi:hypothetical protein
LDECRYILEVNMRASALVAVALGAVILRVGSLPSQANPAVAQADRPVTVGGAIEELVALDGKVFIASERRVNVYREDPLLHEVEYVFDSYPSHLAASDGRVVVRLSSGEYYVVDSLGASAMPLPIVGSQDWGPVSAMALVGDFLVIGYALTGFGVVDLSAAVGSTAVEVIGLSEVVSGTWQLTAIAAVDADVYATVYGLEGDAEGALVRLGIEPTGEWGASIVSRYGGHQQSRALVVSEDGETAFVETVTNVLAIDVESGDVAVLTITDGVEEYPKAIAFSGTQLVVLSHGFPPPADGHMQLSVFERSPEQGWSRLGGIHVFGRLWSGARLAASNGHVYVAGRDDVVKYRVDRALISKVDGATIETVAVAAAVQDSGGDLVVSRAGAVCRYAWGSWGKVACAEVQGTARRLVRVGRLIVGVTSLGHLVAVRAGPVPEMALEVSALVAGGDGRFIALEANSDGAVAVWDNSPPRVVQKQFRIEQVSVSADGELGIIQSGSTVRRPCQEARFSAAGQRVVVACDQEIDEYEWRDGDLVHTGNMGVEGRITAVAIDDDGVVLAGTRSGIRQYDIGERVLRVHRSADPVNGLGVLALAVKGPQTIAVYGDASVERLVVMRYCHRVGSCVDELMMEYERIGSYGAIDIQWVTDGLLFLPGNSVAHILGMTHLRPRVFLPILRNDDV